MAGKIGNPFQRLVLIESRPIQRMPATLHRIDDDDNGPNASNTLTLA